MCFALPESETDELESLDISMFELLKRDRGLLMALSCSMIVLQVTVVSPVMVLS